MIKTRTVAAVAAATLLALSACGTTESPKDREPASGAKVTVTDSRGEKVELPAPAKDVVVLEWGDAEMLMSLGVKPVGLAGAKDFNTWVSAETVDDEVKDVGTRVEPSHGTITGLDPDLVIAEGTRDDNIVEQLEADGIPVLVTKGADASGDEIDRVKSDLRLIAEATGTSDAAKKLIDDFDAKVADAKKALAEAGVEDGSFVMADGYKEGNVLSIRPFGKGSLMSRVATELGLTNAWEGKVDKMWGLGATDVEGLTAIKDADTKFVYNASDGEDLFAEGLKGNPIWTKLPFVEAGNVHRLTDGIWTFGGPKSCMQFIDELVRVYTS